MCSRAPTQPPGCRSPAPAQPVPSWGGRNRSPCCEDGAVHCLLRQAMRGCVPQHPPLHPRKGDGGKVTCCVVQYHPGRWLSSPGISLGECLRAFLRACGAFAVGWVLLFFALFLFLSASESLWDGLCSGFAMAVAGQLHRHQPPVPVSLPLVPAAPQRCQWPRLLWVHHAQVQAVSHGAWHPKPWVSRGGDSSLCPDRALGLNDLPRVTRRIRAG